jgi:TetR/AcrR family transcriptional regulator, regulator of cefoperazone and chloramphenicol sensitivity
MRRTVAKGYPRGEETRARILTVAVDLFGTRGFDSVSTREIAVASSVPPASLRYYFANKQGLYIACLEHLQGQVFQLMEPALIEAEALLDGTLADCDRLIASFCALQEALVDSMIGGADGGTAALFIVRHDLPSEGGAGNLSGDETEADRAMTCFTRMVMRISGGQLDAQLAARVAGLINGQLINIYVRRNRLADEGWDITPERLQWLKRMIRKNSTAMLQAHRVEHEVADGAAVHET